MADIQTFKAELGSLLGYDPTEADAKGLLIQACYDVVNRFKKINPSLLNEFATSTSLTDSTAYNLVTTFTYAVLDVVRNDSNRNNRCNRIPPSIRGQAGDANSLYYATAHSPVYYILNQNLSILPVPSAEEKAALSVVAIADTVTNYDTGISSITGFPASYHQFIMLFTAYGLLLQKITGYADNTDITAALAAATTSIAKFAAIITSLGTSSTAAKAVLDSVAFTSFETAIAEVEQIMTTITSDWEDWITSEDSEMAQTTLAGTQARIGEAQAELARISEEIKQAQGYNMLNQAYTLEVDAVMKEVNGNLQWVQAKIGDITNNIGIYKATASALLNKYEKLFVPYAQAEERTTDRSQ